MGITKIKGFSDSVVLMSNVLKALGHPARIEILNFIKLNPNATCMQIVSNISLSQSTISKHLFELKNVNLLATNRISNLDCYNINFEVLNESLIFIENFINNANSKKIKNVTTFPKIKSENLEFEIKKNLDPIATKYETLKPKINLNRKKTEIDLKKFNHIFNNKKNNF